MRFCSIKRNNKIIYKSNELSGLPDINLYFSFAKFHKVINLWYIFFLSREQVLTKLLTVSFVMPKHVFWKTKSKNNSVYWGLNILPSMLSIKSTTCLVSGKGCGLWLWHSLDFSLIFFCYTFCVAIAASSQIVIIITYCVVVTCCIVT